MTTMHAESTRQTTVEPKNDPKFAHLHEYLGYWAFEERMFQKISQQARPHVATHLNLHASGGPGEPQAAADRYSYEVTSDGVALIEMRGPMMKFSSSFGGNSTVAVRRKIRNAVADKFVNSIVLVIDSPGGTVSGTKELADDVAEAKKKKPVYAFIEDYCCSAAYWVGSQCTKMFSNSTALVGCIGTYMVVYDQSEQYAEEGVVTHVVRAGDFKGAGVPGTKITSEQLAEWQSEVNDLNEFFIRGVAAGRGVTLEAARKWADGRAHVANKGQKMGLIDGVTTLEATIDMATRARKPRQPSESAASAAMADSMDPADCPMKDCPMKDGMGGKKNCDGHSAAAEAAAFDILIKKGSASAGLVPVESFSDLAAEPQITAGEPSHPQPGGPGDSPPKEEKAMSTEVKDELVAGTALLKPLAAEPATLAQIKAGCPGADNDFIVEQLQAGATLATAQTAWMVEQGKRIEVSKAETDKARLAAGSAGNAPLGDKPGKGPSAKNFDGDPIEAYRDLFNEKLAAGKKRIDINQMIARENPELHAAYLEACQAEYKAGNPSKRRLLP